MTLKLLIGKIPFTTRKQIHHFQCALKTPNNFLSINNSKHFRHFRQFLPRTTYTYPPNLANENAYTFSLKAHGDINRSNKAYISNNKIPRISSNPIVPQYNFLSFPILVAGGVTQTK